eukprot:27171-Chlamydomonas_euryale.AAC.1
MYGMCGMCRMFSCLFIPAHHRSKCLIPCETKACGGQVYGVWGVEAWGVEGRVPAVLAAAAHAPQAFLSEYLITLSRYQST